MVASYKRTLNSFFPSHVPEQIFLSIILVNYDILCLIAASTANILGGDKPDKPEPLKERHAPVTKYGLQKEIVVDGKGKSVESMRKEARETIQS